MASKPPPSGPVAGIAIVWVSVIIEGVDERDSSWEDPEPRYRVYFFEGGDCAAEDCGALHSSAVYTYPEVSSRTPSGCWRTCSESA
jgi:hypothetical protein